MQTMESVRRELENICTRPWNIMEVCGTHTMAIAKEGIRSILPHNLKITSGPGCPVCVTSQTDIHRGIQLAEREDVIVATFGDMLKVPSRGKCLMNFSNIKVVYSPLEALKVASENPAKEIVLLGVGFETTAPLIASTILEANEASLKNFSVLPLHKLVPPALEAILSDPDHQIDGFILPGHVSVITGTKYYDFLKKYPTVGVVAGFDGAPIMDTLKIIVEKLNREEYGIINNYPELVTVEGNTKAQEVVERVYQEADANWRGIGVIPGSGLAIREEFSAYDADKKFPGDGKEVPEIGGCICGDILMGKQRPQDCRHFGGACTPATPLGPCMVSSEGTCAAYYKYNVD